MKKNLPNKEFNNSVEKKINTELTFEIKLPPDCDGTNTCNCSVCNGDSNKKNNKNGKQ